MVAENKGSSISVFINPNDVSRAHFRKEFESIFHIQYIIYCIYYISNLELFFEFEIQGRFKVHIGQYLFIPSETIIILLSHIYYYEYDVILRNESDFLISFYSLLIVKMTLSVNIPLLVLLVVCK